MIPRNWTVSSYTNDTYTKLVTIPANVDAIIIANTTVGAISVKVAVTDYAGAVRAVILPTKSVAANTAETLSIPGFKVGSGDILQVQATAAGVNFLASGSEIK